MKKVIAIFCLSLILSSCTKPVVENEQTQETSQNLTPTELDKIWNTLDQKVYRCEQPCSRQDLTEINFSHTGNHYMMLTEDKTGFIEAFDQTSNGIKMNINWDDGSGGFKNEDLDFIFADERHFTIKDQHHHSNQYQFFRSYDE